MESPKGPEERLDLVEAMLSAMADLVYHVQSRTLATLIALEDKGLVTRDEVFDLMRTIEGDIEQSVEFGDKFEAFRRWRRMIEGGGPAPDDTPREPRGDAGAV